MSDKVLLRNLLIAIISALIAIFLLILSKSIGTEKSISEKVTAIEKTVDEIDKKIWEWNDINPKNMDM